MRSLFLGQMGTKAETHSQTSCRVRDLGILSPKWNVSIKSLPSERRQPCGRGSWKEHRSHRELGVNQENQVFQITISKYPVSSQRLKQPAQGLHHQTTPGFCFYIMGSSLVFLWDSWVCEWVNEWMSESVSDSCVSLWLFVNFNVRAVDLFYYFLKKTWMNEWMNE